MIWNPLMRFAEEAATETAAEATAETPVAKVAEKVTEFDWNGLWTKISDLAVSAAWRIVLAFLALIIGKLFIRLILRMMRKSKLIQKMEDGAEHFLLSFVKIALNILLILSLVAILGVPMSSMVAVLAAAGAAIGLALQGALSNFAGGLMILIFHPFRLDDYIEVAGNAGTVTDIGVFYTTLRTPDNKNVTIPNGTIMAQSITNFSAHDTRRLELSFTVAYGTDVEKVKTALLETAAAHEMVLDDPAPFAKLKAHEDSAMRFILRVWVKRENYWTVNFDLMEAINNRFREDGITIPFPQMDVHMIPAESEKEEKNNGGK